MTDEEELVDFLLARIAEDEARVHAAFSRRRALDWTDERVAADCRAKRQIVAQLASAKEWMDSQPFSEQIRSDVTPPHAYYMATREAVKAHAAVYAGHPHFREEWRPGS